jgi:hypothetical protein
MYVWRRPFIRHIVEWIRPPQGPHLRALIALLIDLMEGGLDFYDPYEEPTITDPAEFGSRKLSE